MQVEIAIDEADCIVFVVSGKDGLTHDDEYVARLLHKTKKPVILAVNKVDDFAQNDACLLYTSLCREARRIWKRSRWAFARWLQESMQSTLSRHWMYR